MSHEQYNNTKLVVADGGLRLDAFLARELSERSRAFWHKAIDSGFVSVNSEPELVAKRKLKKHDVIEVNIPDKPIVDAELPIIYEDDHVVVVNKPSGLLTHNKSHWLPEPSVADILAPRLNFAQHHIRTGIVHRLDRDTSGVMIVAKDEATLSYLQKQFHDRKVHKTYVAIVDGILADKQALIDLPLGQNPNRPTTFMVDPSGKPAQTKYRVLAESQSRSLVQLYPKTGRTHQLRVHLAHIGAPIVGDVIYGRPAKRLMLHAQSIDLAGPDGDAYQFSVEAPFSSIDLEKS